MNHLILIVLIITAFILAPAQAITQVEWNRQECNDKGWSNYTDGMCKAILQMNCRAGRGLTWLTGAECTAIMECIGDQEWQDGYYGYCVNPNCNASQELKDGKCVTLPSGGIGGGGTVVNVKVCKDNQKLVSTPAGMVCEDITIDDGPSGDDDDGDKDPTSIFVIVGSAVLGASGAGAAAITTGFITLPTGERVEVQIPVDQIQIPPAVDAIPMVDATIIGTYGSAGWNGFWYGMNLPVANPVGFTPISYGFNIPFALAP
jgi:hypothetical protein